MWAAINGHEAVAELLVANGAEINARDQLQRTPLKRAAMNGHLAAIELLIRHGADVDAVGNTCRLR